MVTNPVTTVNLQLARPGLLADRLHAWANLIALVGQRLEDPAAVLRILTEGVRRVMAAQYSAMLVNVEPGVLEVKAVSGVDPELLIAIEQSIQHPLIGWRIELNGGPLAEAFLDRTDTFVTEFHLDPMQESLRQLLNLQTVWNLPLAISPNQDCVGMILLGRAQVEPPTEDDRALAAAFMAQAAVGVKNAQLYETERFRRRREQRLRSLAEAQQQVAATVGATLDLSVVAGRVLSAITKLIPCDTASLYLRYGDAMRVCAVHNLPDELIDAEYVLAWPLAEQMMITRAPVWRDDVKADARAIALPDAESVRGWLAAPLVIGERVIGQVSLGSMRANAYGVEEAELLESVAWQSSLALENAQLYSEATRRLQQMATLNEISTAAISTLDFDEVVDRMAQAMRRTLRYESLTLWMATDSGGQLSLRPVGTGLDPIPWGKGRVGQVAMSGVALVVNSIGSGEAESTSPAEMAGTAQSGSQLCVPIRIGDRVQGVIDTRSERPTAFNDADVHLLSIVAGQLVGALENARLYAAERRRTEETMVMLDVAEAVSSSFDLTSMVTTAARRTAQVCRVDMCLALLLDEDEAHFQLAGHAMSDEADRVLDWVAFTDLLRRFDFSDNPRMMETLTVGQPRVVAANELAGPLWKFFSSNTPLNLLMLVPLRLTDRSLGMMILGNLRAGHEFDARQASLAAAIARQLAVAVDALRLRQVETERTGYLGVLYQVSRSISATLDPDTVLNAAVREIVVRFPYSLASILILDEEQGELEQRAAAGLGTHLIPVGYRYPVSSGIIGHVARTGHTYVTNDVTTDPYYTPTFDSTTGAELVVPLKREGRVIGVLNLDKPPGGKFAESEIMAMETLAGHVATALENAYLYARTRQTVRELSESLEQLKQTQMQLIQSAKLAAVGQLAAGVAHEINNPLTTISGFSELILEDLPPDNAIRNDLTMIRREAQRARDVVRRLLDFARQSGPHSEPADLNDVVRETVILMRNAAVTKSVKVIERYAPDLPWARIDVNQIKQVVLNLLNNAVQAMPKGGSLTVATETALRDRPGICLRLADTGVGIPTENLERIFEPFFTTKPPGEGTGLGLALSYSIVREHGGVIEVSSVMNKGTIFTIWLPVDSEQYSVSSEQ
ncbi:MAG TPA: GAF domain-containing protein [Anaerolineales bacterium]|nr:GAF domain-containing protein [Anaerolineales bacterium]